MIRRSAYDANGPDTRFDHDYYEGPHRELVVSRLGPLGLHRIEMLRGMPGADGEPAPYVTTGNLYFDSVEQLRKALAVHGPEILADVPNYTNVRPVVEISEVAVSLDDAAIEATAGPPDDH